MYRNNVYNIKKNSPYKWKKKKNGKRRRTKNIHFNHKADDKLSIKIVYVCVRVCAYLEYTAISIWLCRRGHNIIRVGGIFVESGDLRGFQKASVVPVFFPFCGGHKSNGATSLRRARARPSPRPSAAAAATYTHSIRGPGKGAHGGAYPSRVDRALCVW